MDCKLWSTRKEVFLLCFCVSEQMCKLMCTYKGKPCNPVSTQGTGIRRGLADYEKQYEIQSEPGAQGNACEPSIQHPLSTPNCRVQRDKQCHKSPGLSIF